MTAPEFAKMTDRVRKLLAQAASVAGTPESEAFQAKAMALMAQYGIDEADARAQNVDLAPGIERVELKISGKYVETRIRMIAMLAAELQCECVQWKGDAARTSVLAIFGRPSALARLELLVELLTPQLLNGADAARPVLDVKHSGELRVFRRSWMRAFASRVAYRLREENERAAVGHTSGALVLVEDAKQAKQAVAEAFPLARPSTSAARNSMEGRLAGDAAGRRAKMNREVH